MGAKMTIEYPLLPRHSFDPEACDIMGLAYEKVLKSLDMHDAADPRTAVVARKVIEFAKLGFRDPHAISDAVLKEFH